MPYLDKEKLYRAVADYIEENFIGDILEHEERAPLLRCEKLAQPIEDEVCHELREEFLLSKEHCSAPSLGPSLVEMLAQMDDSFAVTLLKLIDAKGLTDVECYKKANVSKQTWYKIMNEANYKPSKNTILSFAIALELSLEETDGLLATVGFTLSPSIKFDVIIEYFLINQVYDIFTINEVLFQFDQPCLGVAL